MATATETPTVLPVRRLPAGDGDLNPLVQKLAHLLDEAIVIPGINRRIGADAIVGLIPVVGDLLGVVMGAVMLAEARRVGVSKRGQAKIVGHYVKDFFVGLVPIVGDLFDAAVKANSKSVGVIREHLERQAASRSDAARSSSRL